MNTKFLLALLTLVTSTEIGAREAIAPQKEVGQIIKEIEEVHLDDTFRAGEYLAYKNASS